MVAAVVRGELRVNEGLTLVARETAGVVGMAVESPVDRTEARHSSRSSGLAGAGTEAQETPALVTAVAGDGWHFGASLAGAVCSGGSCSWRAVAAVAGIATVRAADLGLAAAWKASVVRLKRGVASCAGMAKGVRSGVVARMPAVVEMDLGKAR